MLFDENAFLESSVSSSNDTRIVPIPQGEYHGIIEKVARRQWQSKDGSQTGIALDVFWSIEDQGVKEYLGRKEVTCKQGIMLDTTPQGLLDMSKGKNIGLGRLREAVGKNEEGQHFSFAMLPGMSAKVAVSHRIVGDEVYSEVKGVTRL